MIHCNISHLRELTLVIKYMLLNIIMVDGWAGWFKRLLLFKKLSFFSYLNYHFESWNPNDELIDHRKNDSLLIWSILHYYDVITFIILAKCTLNKLILQIAHYCILLGGVHVFFPNACSPNALIPTTSIS